MTDPIPERPQLADPSLVRRLADLLVEALELGSGKHEPDELVAEIFRPFGIDFYELASQYRRTRLRREAADRLSEAAPSAEDLINEVVRCGGRFVDMVQDVYGRLARHAVTAGGRETDSFRLQRAGVNEDQLVISEAFIEQVRSLQDKLRSVAIGALREADIRSFIGADGGRLYGGWPIRSRNGSWRLADEVVTFGQIAASAREQLPPGPGRQERASVIDRAQQSADRLVNAAENLLRSHVAHTDLLTTTDAETAVHRLFFFSDEGSWIIGEAIEELERFRSERVLGLGVQAHHVENLSSNSLIGLRAAGPGARLTAQVQPAEPRSGTGAAQLSYFVALYRLGLSSTRDHGASLPSFADPDDLAGWFERFGAACDEAADWLAADVLIRAGSLDIQVLLESFEEYLNLPLWKQRHLLYEIWVLCATLDACEQTGWTVDLRGLSKQNGTWMLSAGQADDPIATLYRAEARAVTLDVWREPARQTLAGRFTPDVSISTPRPYLRDLLVVEAKDRHKMPAGRHRDEPGDPLEARQRTAWGVAKRYAAGLQPLVTWVCNHNEFRQDADSLPPGTTPGTDDGGPWTRIYLAGDFRPGHVPALFAESVRVALTVPGAKAEEPGGPAGELAADAAIKPDLILVIDVTGSMSSRLPEIYSAFLAAPALASVSTCRAVLYSDHGPGEPFLIREEGPCADLPALIELVRAVSPGAGGDRDEALEDAMQRCRELVEDLGPQRLLILTDAPPHPPGDCPYSINFDDQVQAILDAGSPIDVASDWLSANDESWSPFRTTAGFRLSPLADILTAPLTTSQQK